jgi:glutamyl-tRNA reductase
MSLWPPFHLIGITHRRADLARREPFARSFDEVAAMLRDPDHPGRHGVIVSTCNRFEVYWWGDEDWTSVASNARARGADPADLRTKTGPAAIRHLLRVAAGLDSQIVGETEVLGQLRQAWRLARGSGTSSRELDCVFSEALAAGSRIRQVSGLGRRLASIGAVAVDAARHLGPRELAGQRILVIGAGHVADRVLAALAGTGAEVEVVSRGLERARRLAAAHGVAAASWDALDQVLGQADLVFAATAAPRSFISADRIAAATADRQTTMTIVDLGVPRNVEPGARLLPRIRILDLDALKAEQPGESTEEADVREEAQNLLENETARLFEKLQGLAENARLAELHERTEALIEEEVAATLTQCPGLTDFERDAVRDMAQRLARRVLFPVSRTVRGGWTTVRAAPRAPDDSEA